LLIGFTLLVFAGCAESKHYYQNRQDRVDMYLKDPQAQNVQFAHSLDGFALHPASRTPTGAWRVSVQLKSHFRYFYMIDGQVYIPPCPYREQDDFGSVNCIYSPDL